MNRREFVSTLAAAPAAFAAAQPQHIIVYNEPGRYGGWPANNGIWVWGNEIVVGFIAGYFKFAGDRHSIDRDRPSEFYQARSLDGGVTWSIEKPEGIAREKISQPTLDLKEPMDFTRPGFALTARMANSNIGPSWFNYSYDKGRTWLGRYALPNFDHPGIAARTDYIIDGKHSMTIMLTAAKTYNQREGRVLCCRTVDGGLTWKLVGKVGSEPEESDFAIMPASVRLGRNTILTAVRHRKFIDLWRTEDNGVTWQSQGNVVPDTGRGNPPSMIKLKDGRLALVWGYRGERSSIRAKLSSDGGKTWSNDIVLRDDGDGWDIGYSRTVQRADGKLVSVYYFTTDQKNQRFIAATIWEAPKA